MPSFNAIVCRSALIYVTTPISSNACVIWFGLTKSGPMCLILNGNLSLTTSIWMKTNGWAICSKCGLNGFLHTSVMNLWCVQNVYAGLVCLKIPVNYLYIQIKYFTYWTKASHLILQFNTSTLHANTRSSCVRIINSFY